jgi:hypothetical protein
LAALIFCAVDKVDFSMVHGETLIENGSFTRFTDAELQEIVRRQNERSVKIYHG